MGIELLSRCLSVQGVKLITYIHVLPRLGMSGAILPLLLHAFMALRRKSLPSPLPLHKQTLKTAAVLSRAKEGKAIINMGKGIIKTGQHFSLV
jgi:hypothetical protein